MTIREGVISMEAAADIDEYTAVELNAGKVQETDADTDNVFGIAQRPASTGEKVPVKVQGTSQAVIDGSGQALAVGDKLMPAAGGKLVKHAGGAGDAFVGELVQVQAGNKDGEIAIVRMYGDRTRTT